MDGWMNAALNHYASTHTGGSTGDWLPDPWWSIVEPIPCPVCGREYGCPCFPPGWNEEEAQYLADWHARVDAGALEMMEEAYP